MYCNNLYIIIYTLEVGTHSLICEIKITERVKRKSKRGATFVQGNKDTTIARHLEMKGRVVNKGNIL